MKVKISYICPECSKPGDVTLDQADIDRGTKDFACSGCGFKNGLTMKPSDLDEPVNPNDIAKAEGYASIYIKSSAFSTRQEQEAVWIGVRAGYLQALEDFRKHMRECMLELSRVTAERRKRSGADVPV